MSTTASTNVHFSSEYRNNVQPNLSSQFSHNSTFNAALTKERDLSRYRTAYSDRTNIFDNARTVSPANYFGKRFVRNYDRVQHYSPAGMDMDNSRVITGEAFTKPVVKTFSII